MREMKMKLTQPPFLQSLVFLLVSYHLVITPWAQAAAQQQQQRQQIHRGFSASPDPDSSDFQPLLSDPTGVFSLGFLCVDSSQLHLDVLHLPSSLPLWRANPARPAPCAASTVLSFQDGTLALSDTKARLLFWSSAAQTHHLGGDLLVLLNSSNLQIHKLTSSPLLLWQSFDFPSDTLVLGQNFTSSASLSPPNQRYSMRLRDNYIGLYMEFPHTINSPAMYWKHTALEAKAQIVRGQGPVYAHLGSLGFLGMYQNEKVPVDVLAFDSFNRGIQGLRRLTLESDGNLRAYYWNSSVWVSDFIAITDACGLPDVCGPYGLCRRSGEPRCECLDTSSKDGHCLPGDDDNESSSSSSSDICGSRGEEGGYQVLRRKGVDAANKDLLPFQKVGSLGDCEQSCQSNCSCWAAFYNNATGFCYRMEYPVQTLLAVGDERKVGYFKVRGPSGGGGGGKRSSVGHRTAEKALLAVGVVIFAGAAGIGAYRIWDRRKRRGDHTLTTQGISAAAGPYKDLSSTSSFRSIELTSSFTK